MNDKKFKISNTKRTVAIWTAVFGIIFTLLIESTIEDINENGFLCFVIAAAVAAGIAFLTTLLVREYYLQVFDDGFEITKGGKVAKYPFSAFAGSDVTRHYLNGIYTGTSREIKIRGVSGRMIEISANNLSKAKFAEVVSYLDRTKYTESLNMEAAVEYFKERHDLTVPNESIIGANKKDVIVRNSFVAGLFIAFLVALIYYLVIDNDSVLAMVIFIISGIAAVLMLFTDTIPDIIAYNKIKNLPARIGVDRDSLMLGDKTFWAGDVLNVLMVPANYEIMSREMVIINKNGEKYEYGFGKIDYKNRRTYSEYGRVYNTLELWCIVNNIKFMKILG